MSLKNVKPLPFDTEKTPKEPIWPEHYTLIDQRKTLRIRKYIADKGVSQADLARLSGMNNATLSLIINAKYPTPPSVHINMMEDAINTQMARDSYHRTIPFVDNTVWQVINSVCTWARNNVDDEGVGIVCGNVGVGKTRALKEYCKRHPGTIYIRAFSSMNISVMLNLLLHETGAQIVRQSGGKYSSGTNQDKLFSLIRHLKNTETLIIMDETTRAQRSCVGVLRDLTHGAGIALVLCGRETLKARFSDSQALRDDDGEVASRSQGAAGIPIILGIQQGDCQMMCEAFWSKIKLPEPLAEDAIDMYWQCCNGEARALARLLGLSYNAWQRKKLPPTPELISHIWRGKVAGGVS